MKQLRKEFEKLRLLLELIKKREKLKQEYYLLTKEILKLQLKDVQKNLPQMNGRKVFLFFSFIYNYFRM